ncbi:MAG: aminotransferase class I/II-fold pyridoxal phosphate-dependent enzyme [Bacteroidota bacterium]
MIIPEAQRLSTVQEYYFSKKLREIAQRKAQGQPILNLGIGNPDLPPAPSVLHALQQAIGQPNNHGYQSYRGIPELRAAFGQWYLDHFQVQLDPESEILPLIGSKEGIMHLSMAFLGEGDQVLVPNPGYPTYRAAAQLAGAEVVEYTLRAEQGWYPDLNALSQLDLRRIKIMWLNYPHMPTGTPANAERLQALIQFAKMHRILLVNDNPYSFILNERPFSLLSIPGAEEVVLELNSLSKSHNMAGWRVGALFGRADYLNTVLKFKSNMDSGMFRAVQLAAVEALKLPTDWYANLNVTYQKRRALVFNLLDALDCTYQVDQVGMFVWARIPDRFDNSFAMSDHLLDQANVFITPGGIFGTSGEAYIRASLCLSEPVLLEATRRIVALEKPVQVERN